MIKTLQNKLKELTNPAQALILQKFFKTGVGEYAEGDKFLGIKVPVLRQVAKSFYEMRLNDLHKIIESPIHEERFVALLILINKYQKTHDPEIQNQIYDFYLTKISFINNWDLVDLSAPQIVGNYLFNKKHDVLDKLASKKHLWSRRISIISTFYFIRQNHFRTTLNLSRKLLNDKDDLIHKAVGWMLREVGKRDIKSLEDFLNIHFQNMPRTMLRYAIEHFPESKRHRYLKHARYKSLRVR